MVRGVCSSPHRHQCLCACWQLCCHRGVHRSACSSSICFRVSGGPAQNAFTSNASLQNSCQIQVGKGCSIIKGLLAAIRQSCVQSCILWKAMLLHWHGGNTSCVMAITNISFFDCRIWQILSAFSCTGPNAASRRRAISDPRQGEHPSADAAC